MDLRQLRYFCAIVEAGGFSRAADRLHVAQSALSLHVRRLEDDLGVSLLVRSAKGASPTAAGLKLAHHAVAILAQVKAAETELRRPRDSARGKVTVGIPAGVGRALNGPLLDAATRDLPDIDFSIVEVLPWNVRDWLAQRTIDLGVCYEVGTGVGSELQLAEEHYYLVSGRPEPGLDGGVALEALAGMPIVIPTCTHAPNSCIVHIAAERGITLEVESRVDSLATILELTIGRPSRSVLTPAAFLPEWRSGRVFAYPIVPAVKRSVLLAEAPGASAQPATRAVQDLVARVAEGLCRDRSWPTRLPAAA